jgi:predicted Zn-dependent protease
MSGEAGARIVVIQDPTLAAFVMPSGRVFIHTGLLSRVESEAQLAMILARELAHETSQLEARPRKGPMPRSALSPTAAAVLALDLKVVAHAAIDGYGRDGEREADATGMRWLGAAGYDPSDAVKLFELLAREGGDRDGLLEIFVYGDRARMGERAEVARDLLGQARSAQASGGNGGGAEAFERRMRAVVRDNAALDIRAGRFALAQRQLDRVLAAAPDDPIAHLAYGDLYRLRSQGASGAARTEAARQALERYERAAELDPKYPETFRQLALLYYQQRDARKARAAFQRYLFLKPDASDAQRVREYLAGLRD